MNQVARPQQKGFYTPELAFFAAELAFVAALCFISAVAGFTLLQKQRALNERWDGFEANAETTAQRKTIAYLRTRIAGCTDRPPHLTRLGWIQDFQVGEARCARELLDEMPVCIGSNVESTLARLKLVAPSR